MFQDLDATLQTVLTDADAPAPVRNAEISFDTPDRDFQPQHASVNLFLHEVSENRALRDNVGVVRRAEMTYTSTPPSLRVDCSYLVTTWSANTAGLKAQEEHQLLGLALLWLSRFPVIDEAYLRGTLANPAQPYPLSTVLAQVKEGRGFGDFWTALGIPPRPAFSLTVTITLQPFDVAEEYPILQQAQIRTGSLDQPTLAGRVLDHALRPVPAVTVTAVEAGAVATTDAVGDFTLPGLPFGTYTLRATAAGHPDQQRSVTYAADGQVHDIIFAHMDR
jgi:hypothetical protein